MADVKKVYDDLIIISLYRFLAFLLNNPIIIDYVENELDPGPLKHYRGKGALPPPSFCRIS